LSISLKTLEADRAAAVVKYEAHQKRYIEAKTTSKAVPTKLAEKQLEDAKRISDIDAQLGIVHRYLQPV
jgi:hypothetical protein